MRKLYTVAFPTLNEADARFVAGIRASHDRQARMLGPHFTLLFACDAVDESTYVEHVRASAAAMPAFRFDCRDAAPDSDEERGYAYLVPSRGRAELTALHDQLYTGPMAAHLRKDLHFVAHITVGHCATFADAQRLCDELDADGIDISGAVDALVVGCVESGRWVELARFALRH
jgi:2'-5' RNA ligase